MAEPDGTAGLESPANDTLAAARSASDEGDAERRPADVGRDEAEGAEDAPPEPPRRRLVAELLEGQEVLDEAASSAQLVAPPIHLETIDAGQPIYQLDLSSEEPRGVIVAPETGGAAGGAAVAPVPMVSEIHDEVSGITGDRVFDALKQMIVDRERRVMAAERDGIEAYELAIELDQFVRSLIEAMRREAD